LSENTGQVVKGVRQDPSDITVDTGDVETVVVDETLPTKKTPKNASKIKLEAVSTTLKPSGYSSPAAGEFSLRSVTFSGNDALIVGGASQTTRSDGNQRKDSRFERKDETLVYNIDDVVCPQTYIETEGPLEISEQPEAVQGSRDRRIPTPVLIQKRSGFVPHERNFNASVDLIERDELVYADKMVIYPACHDPSTYPDKNFAINADGQVTESTYENKRGNFLPRFLKVEYDLNTSQVKNFYIESDDLTIENVGDDVANRSAPTALTHRNRIELARQVIYSKSGDPMSDKHSPLGRKVYQPNGVLSMMYDYEVITGSEIMLSMRSLSHALSYQLNKAAKDGQRPHESAFEMASSSILSMVCSAKDLYDTSPNDSKVFDTTLMRKGLATMLISAFDSTAKYGTRGDLLVQRRSFRSFLEAAKNHCSTFRYPADLLKYLNNKQVFSTISHEYDEQMPVYATGFTGLVHPRDWDTCFSVTNGTINGEYLIKYNDGIDSTFTYMSLPLLKGIYRYLNKNGRKICQTLKEKRSSQDSNWDGKLVIPICHSFINITLWDQLVCAATTDIEYCRQESLKELIDYERNHGQVFGNLENINYNNICQAKMYTFRDYVTPLGVGRMTKECAYSWLLPELYLPIYENNTGANARSMMLPFIMSEATITSCGEFDEDYLAINFPMVRRGINLDALNSIVESDERQYRLSLDIPTSLPQYYRNIDTEDKTISYYKYSKTTHGTPIISYEYTGAQHPTLRDFLCVPRELGLGFVPPQFYLRPHYNNGTLGYYSRTNTVYDGSQSYIATVWFGDVDAPLAILGDSARNNARGANYFQTWEKIFALRNSGVSDDSERIYLSRNALFTAGGAVSANRGKFKPVADECGDLTPIKMPYFFNLNKADYFIEQMMDFLVNPFDVAGLPNLSSTNTIILDPLDRLYKYGFIGFIASDYTEDARNRLDVTDVAGMSYVEDYYHDDTPLLQ
jgi:hypothetical protein